MRKQQLVNLAAGATFVMSGAASAIEIVDTENVPRGYAISYEVLIPDTTVTSICEMKTDYCCIKQLELSIYDTSVADLK